MINIDILENQLHRYFSDGGLTIDVHLFEWHSQNQIPKNILGICCPETSIWQPCLQCLSQTIDAPWYFIDLQELIEQLKNRLNGDLFPYIFDKVYHEINSRLLLGKDCIIVFEYINCLPSIDPYDFIQMLISKLYEKIQTRLFFVLINKNYQNMNLSAMNGIEWCFLRPSCKIERLEFLNTFYKIKAIDEEVMSFYERTSYLATSSSELLRIYRQIVRKSQITHCFKETLHQSDFEETGFNERFYMPQTPIIGSIYAMGMMGAKAMLIRYDVLKTAGFGKINLCAPSSESIFRAVKLAFALEHDALIEFDSAKNHDLYIDVIPNSLQVCGESSDLPIVLSIISSLTKKALRPKLAATGMLTLNGSISPVDAIIDKLILAYDKGIHIVLIPESQLNFVTKNIPLCIQNKASILQSEQAHIHDLSNEFNVIGVKTLNDALHYVLV